MIPEYTTIEKKVKEFDVLITNNPAIFDDRFPDKSLLKTNLVRVYCKHEGLWATFLMSKKMINLDQCDKFIYELLVRQFDKTKNSIK